MKGRSKRFVIAIAAVSLVLVAFQTYATGVEPGTVRRIGGGVSSVPHCKVVSFTVSTDTNGDIDLVTPQVLCSEAGTYDVSATLTAGAATGSGVATAALTPSAAGVPVILAPAVSFVDGYEVVFHVRVHAP